MESFHIEQTFQDLMVLAAIEQDDKLCTLGNAFDIHPPSTTRAMWRRWMGERREDNAARMRTVIYSGFEFVHKSRDDVTSFLQMPSMHLKASTVALQNQRMMEALRNSIRGLQNLSQTYRDDALFSAKLHNLMQEIEEFQLVMRPMTDEIYPIGSQTLAESRPPPQTSDGETEVPDTNVNGQ